MIRDNDKQVAVQAVAPATTSSTITGIAVDGTGFGRARFVFNFGANSSTIAALTAGLSIWAASTSGGTYTAISGASLAAVTSGVLGGNVMVVDTAIPTASPWVKASGAIVNTNIIVSGLVELYEGVSRPPTHSEQQIVAVG